MSYDISLYLNVDSGGPEPLEVCVASIGNYTVNVARMWTDALGHSLGDLKGTNAGDSQPALAAAIDRMTANPDRYRAMEPANGWGDYEGALAYLTALRDACAVHPKASIHILH
ncbi:hypothetical protein ACFV9E_06370 [Streptomyces sp. NPDC059835]|uniref:hypothetical protein n=1 Tax=Streptomyces sp. NPDC059835 TaxID=3346967 RepID=UPI003647C5BC